MEARLRSEFSQAIDEMEERVTALEGRLTGPYGFYSVSIGNIVNDQLERLYQDPPIGRIFLGGVPFEIPASDTFQGIDNMFWSKTSRHVSVDLPDGLCDVIAVCLLLNSTNTFQEDRGLEVGRVELLFEAGRHEVPLVAGENIREWNYSNPQALRTVSSETVVEVARPCRGDSSGEEVVIDMLRIDVPYRLIRSPLERIIFDNTQPARQHLLVSGITCIVGV